MWIKLKKGNYPKKEGEYKTLVDWDGEEKAKQKELLIEIMKEDEESGMYENEETHKD